jgi:hypothetical protein
VQKQPFRSSYRDRGQKIFAYLGVLILLLAFGAPSGGLIDIPISFLLKNRLHLQASELANFRLAAALPLYLSFVFGFVRDTWSPFGMGDRGFLCLFGSLSSVLYIVFAFTPVSYVTLLFAIVLLTVFPIRIKRSEWNDGCNRSASFDDGTGKCDVEHFFVCSYGCGPPRRGVA